MAWRQSALKAFELNIADAHLLVSLARALTNQRSYRMRRSLREKMGQALGMTKAEQDQLDCLESEDVFVIIKPDSQLQRDAIDVRPLLRQAIVATCAAIETYASDRVMELYGDASRRDELPSGMAGISLSLGQYRDIKDRYEREGWGIRALVTEAVEKDASPAPKAINRLFGIVARTNILPEVDRHLKQSQGTTHEFLAELADRRNRIAHTGDRKGGGRAQIDADEVESMLDEVERIIEALDVVTKDED